jgi:signal transduction histidine kinase
MGAPSVPSPHAAAIDSLATRERQVLDALPLTVFAVDLDGRITFVSRAWSRFAGTAGTPQLGEESSVIGLPIWDAMPDVAPRTRIESAMAQIRGGRANTLTWEFPCDGSAEERVCLMHVSALVEGHTLTGFVFSTLDISSSHRSRAILIDTAMALAQPISVERALQEVSQQLRRATGCDAVAVALPGTELDTLRLAYQTGFDVEPRELESALRPAWRHAIEAATNGRGATASSLVSVHVTPQGTEITAPMTSARVQGAVTVLVAGLEATEHREELKGAVAAVASQAALAIERAQLVERTAHRRRLDAIGEVSAGVAHELRNPLFGISSAAQLLRFRVRDDPVIEKNVGRILREVERLNGMVTSLLEYGRPAPMRPARGDPDEVWQDVIAVQRGLLESKALILRHEPATPRVVCSIDVEHLAQVFVNVLVNAVDAAPEGSDLTLVASGLPNGGWRARLHNGGAPIAADVLPRVFELFFSTKPGSTGIGLAICQRIVEEHGGSISIESNAEQGTTVTISLPGSTDDATVRYES